MRIRGTLRTAVFEKETVNAVGGQLWLANSTVVTQSVAQADDFIVVENASGFMVDEIIFAKKVNGQGFSKEFMKITSMSREDSSSDDNFVGTLFVDRDTNQISSSFTSSISNLNGAINAEQTEITIDDNAPVLDRSIIKVDFEYMKVTGSRGDTKIQVLRGADGSQKVAHSDNAVVGQLSRDAAMVASFLSPRETYTPGQVLVSTGRFMGGEGNNTTGSGYMLLNSNPTTGDTPYMDFAERTGSGVYDIRLKTRLGDLSGLIKSRFGREVGISDDPGFGLASENVFLSGMIRANSGSIGGINMGSSQISTGGGGHGTANTGFFANDDGDFSLGDSVIWTAEPGTLAVSGSAVTFETPKFFFGESGTSISGSNGNILISGSAVDVRTKTFYLGNSSNFLSGSNGNLSIASETFDLQTTNLRIESSTPSIRVGGASSQRVTLGSSTLTFHNSSNTQVLTLQNSMSKTINLAGAGLGGSGATTFTANGGIDLASAGALFINGTASGSFNDVFLGPNNFVMQTNNQAENYSFSLGNYLDGAQGGNLSTYGLSCFAYQGQATGSINMEAMNIKTTVNTLSSLTAPTSLSDIRGATIGLIDNAFAHSVTNAKGLYVNMLAKDTGSNYAIYVDFQSQETLLGSKDVVGSGYGLYSTAKIASEKDIIAFVSSDNRLKTNIKPIKGSLDKILNIEGVSFEWKDGYDDRVQNKTNLGVIAQDVQKVVPEIVKERQDGYLAVQYDQLIPVLIESIKDQQKQIDDLKKKLEEL